MAERYPYLITEAISPEELHTQDLIIGFYYYLFRNSPVTTLLRLKALLSGSEIGFLDATLYEESQTAKIDAAHHVTYLPPNPGISLKIDSTLGLFIQPQNRKYGIGQKLFQIGKDLLFTNGAERLIVIPTIASESFYIEKLNPTRQHPHLEWLKNT